MYCFSSENHVTANRKAGFAADEKKTPGNVDFLTCRKLRAYQLWVKEVRDSGVEVGDREICGYEALPLMNWQT